MTNTKKFRIFIERVSMPMQQHWNYFVSRVTMKSVRRSDEKKGFFFFVYLFEQIERKSRDRSLIELDFSQPTKDLWSTYLNITRFFLLFNRHTSFFFWCFVVSTVDLFLFFSFDFRRLTTSFSLFLFHFSAQSKFVEKFFRRIFRSGKTLYKMCRKIQSRIVDDQINRCTNAVTRHFARSKNDIWFFFDLKQKIVFLKGSQSSRWKTQIISDLRHSGSLWFSYGTIAVVVQIVSSHQYENRWTRSNGFIQRSKQSIERISSVSNLWEITWRCHRRTLQVRREKTKKTLSSIRMVRFLDRCSFVWIRIQNVSKRYSFNFPHV